MKIVTWNMGFWQFNGRHEEAWDYLTDVIKPDVALLQEAHPPTSREGEHLVYRRIGGRRDWGSAVYTNNLPPPREVVLEGRRGWVAAVEVTLPDGEDAVVVSVHAQIIGGHVFPNLSDIFDELMALLEGRRFIVGGDLNSCRLIDKVYRITSHNEFFDRIEAGRFFNCHRKFHAGEQQTFWGSGIRNPYQDDHLFVSADLAGRVVSCEVLDNTKLRELSDHSPVAAELQICGSEKEG
jgi:endonuclease/exonuclease/phosphatase family metal-dependent hydrolase